MDLSSQSVQSGPVQLLDVNRGNHPLLDTILEEIKGICESGRFIGGDYCKKLESMISEQCQTEFAIGCASGSDALLLALMAINLKPGDEVIVPSFTFFASISAITRLGGRPVFIDIDPVTFNMNPDLIESLITSRTRAIMPVHLFGQCADMQSVNEIAQQHRLHVIEDAAQAIGATFDGNNAGSMSDFGCISFYPTKNLGGFGDAGMVTTSNPDLAKRARLLANHGMEPRYYHKEIGINSRLDSIQAAVLGIKLQHLRRYDAMRLRNAMTYRKLMTSNGLAGELNLPETSGRCGHVWNQFTIRIPDGRRDAVRARLAERGIGTEIYYPVPMHMQECFSYLDCPADSLPETCKAAAEVLSLPIYPELTRQEIESVVHGLADCMFDRGRLRKAS